jgi:hypothetical protein
VSLTTAVPEAKFASPESVAYLVALLEERTENVIDPEQFGGMTQLAVSDAIERARLIVGKPATDEQLAEVAALHAQLGRGGTLVSKDTGQAKRQIASMKAEIATREEKRLAAMNRKITPERATATDEFLAALLTPTSVKQTDEIPF